jgi:sugar phosphate isomerase/epimerase
MQGQVRFGLSTHLFHDQPLGPAHFTQVAAHGFLLVELFATRTHFDYHSAAAARDLGKWLTDEGLFLHSVHAPIAEGLVGSVWGGAYSNAAGDEARRQRAVREAEAALQIADVVPFEYLVVHLGVPDAQRPGTGQNVPDAARRSVTELAALASKRGVRLALEVIPNRLSTPEALVRLIEDELDTKDIGICLDYGHAFLGGDLADAIEVASGHLVTTHVHDNDGREDSHLVPFEGRIDWSTAVMTTQKVGYEGVWLMELANTSSPDRVLAGAQRACHQLEEFLIVQD